MQWIPGGALVPTRLEKLSQAAYAAATPLSPLSSVILAFQWPLQAPPRDQDRELHHCALCHVCQPTESLSLLMSLSPKDFMTETEIGVVLV